MPYYLYGAIAHEHVFQNAMAMGADDQKVYIVFFAIVQNGLGGLAFQYFDINIPAT